MWVNGGAAESFTQGFTWNDLGDVASLSYPQCTHTACTATSPRTVSFGYTNGFLTSVPGYASLLRYHPNGMVWQVLHANGVTDTVALDSSGMARPASISTSGANSNWSTGSYRYDGAGNVSQMGSGTYTYDGVSRLTRAVTFVGQSGGGTGYVRTYDYDSYGNLEAIAGSGGRTLAVDHATNRLTGSVVYDAAGNMTYRNGTTYYYDSSGMLWKQVAPDGSERLYFYDADDERFWSYHGSGSDWALRDLDGKVLRLYHSGTGGWSVTRDYVYRGGRLLAGVEPGVATYHYSLDHLGSPRLITNGSGNKTAYHVYHPYGDVATYWNQDSERMKFTGHEREFGDTGGSGDDLDYMHARYYGLAVARFLSFDPVGGNPRSGQSWNRYAYVLGNPLRFVDPLGLKEGSPCTSEDGKITCDGGSVDAGNNQDPLKEGGRSMDQTTFGNFLFGAHAGGSRRSSYAEQQAASGLSVSQFANYIAANGGTGECDFACQVMRGVAANSLTGTVYLETGVLAVTEFWLLSPAGAFTLFTPAAVPPQCS
jgi:RHS repeat-associated protein